MQGTGDGLLSYVSWPGVASLTVGAWCFFSASRCDKVSLQLAEAVVLEHLAGRLPTQGVQSFNFYSLAHLIGLVGVPMQKQSDMKGFCLSLSL
jgi:hypothetical protein